MTRSFSLLILGFVLAGAVLARGAHAAEFENLYTVTVEVDASAGGPDAERAVAEREAMAVLLTRVTGRQEAGDAPELAHLIQNAARYVNSYGSPRRGEIQVGFSRSAVESELTALDWPVWGPERPLTLVWLAVDLGNGERGVLSASSGGEASSEGMRELLAGLDEELRATADRRGLPLTLPLWDLEDINAISFAELWGGFDVQIAEASRRYGADAVLVGRVQQTSFGNRAQWTLLRDRERHVFVASGVAGGLHWLADRFSAEFASVGGALSARMTVSDVQSFSDYGRVMSFLGSASVLERVDVESYEDDVLTLRVAARGDPSTLERVLTLGEVLAPVPRTFGQSSDNALAFRVVR